MREEGRRSLRHWLAKCIVVKVLEDLGFRCVTEAQFGRKIVDVLCFDNKTAYEIESNEKKGYTERVNAEFDYWIRYSSEFGQNVEKPNLVVFHLKNMPKDYEELHAVLTSFFEKEKEKVQQDV